MTKLISVNDLEKGDLIKVIEHVDMLDSIETRESIIRVEKINRVKVHFINTTYNYGLAIRRDSDLTQSKKEYYLL